MTSGRELSDVDLIAVYEDLHAHPELAFQETRTANLVATMLAGWGYQVHTGIGGTGVVGVLDNGPGGTVMLRADMDALPVLEQTGSAYASQVRSTDHLGQEVPVMHACGHDLHVTCLLGAASVLAAERETYSGRLLLVFQPAEELGAGARAMVGDGLFDRFGSPDIVLGQHVAPLPAGLIGLHAGPAMAASDTLNITLYGSGGHGSRPEATVDPVVMAAATVLRLQTIVSRETAATEMSVLTVGSIHAGTAANVVPDRAQLQVSVRTLDPAVRQRTLAAIRRIVVAEAEASHAPRPPEIERIDHFPVVVNDPVATERTRAGFVGAFGEGALIDPGVVTGSEDVGVFAEAAGTPVVFWFLGGADPAEFAHVTVESKFREVLRSLPSNHAPTYAPVLEPTLRTGVHALVSAAHTWMPMVR